MSDRPDSAANDGRLLLEELSDRAMPGADRQHLGHWVLRASRGATSRANTVWPSGDPDRPLTAACDVVEQWYRDRGLVAGFQVWDGAEPGLAAELDRRGYQRAEGALVFTRGVADWSSSTDATKTDQASSVKESSSPLVERLFTEPDRLAELLDSELRKCFVTVSDGAGGLLGGGIGVLDRNELGVFAMKTFPAARRQGVARHVLDELVGWGRSTGASTAWLQVMASNGQAAGLYASCGFEQVHEYHYRLTATDEPATPPSGIWSG